MVTVSGNIEVQVNDYMLRMTVEEARELMEALQRVLVKQRDTFIPSPLIESAPYKIHHIPSEWPSVSY